LKIKIYIYTEKKRTGIHAYILRLEANVVLFYTWKPIINRNIRRTIIQNEVFSEKKNFISIYVVVKPIYSSVFAFRTSKRNSQLHSILLIIRSYLTQFAQWIFWYFFIAHLNVYFIIVRCIKLRALNMIAIRRIKFLICNCRTETHRTNFQKKNSNFGRIETKTVHTYRITSSMRGRINSINRQLGSTNVFIVCLKVILRVGTLTSTDDINFVN